MSTTLVSAFTLRCLGFRQFSACLLQREVLLREASWQTKPILANPYFLHTRLLGTHPYDIAKEEDCVLDRKAILQTNRNIVNTSTPFRSFPYAVHQLICPTVCFVLPGNPAVWDDMLSTFLMKYRAYHSSCIGKFTISVTDERRCDSTYSYDFPHECLAHFFCRHSFIPGDEMSYFREFGYQRTYSTIVIDLFS